MCDKARMLLSTPHASVFVTVAMGALACLVLAAWNVLLWRATRATPRRFVSAAVPIGVSLAWLALTCGLAAAGVFADFEQVPPRLVFVLVPMVVGLIVFGRSGRGHALATQTPLWVLVGIQAFRLPLELVMHAAASEGTMPPQMTFGVVDGSWGLNYDILTGASAVVMALLVRRGRLGPTAVKVWNIAGLLLLVAIVANAVASLPIIAAFGSDTGHVNTWIAFAPFVWLPTVLVGAALLGHLVTFRALRELATSGRGGTSGRGAR